jgi:polysaccharide export outer membrane protein
MAASLRARSARRVVVFVRWLALFVIAGGLYLGHGGSSRGWSQDDDPFAAASKLRLPAGAPLPSAPGARKRTALERRELAELRRARDLAAGARGLSTLAETGSAAGEAESLPRGDPSVSPGGDEAPAQPERAERLPPSEFELQLRGYADPLVLRSVEQFGYDVFRREIRDPVDLAVGGDYVLGTGDQVVVSVWGNVVDEDFAVTIDREGQVRLPDVGLVALKGLRISEAEEVLKRRFGELYVNFQLRLRLARVRDMHVHVVGRVARPGRVDVPAIATLFDVLSATGGVTKDGSLRNVVLRRAGESPRAIDLYAYLLDGDLSVDLSLAPGDSIVVPAVGGRVAIVGRVLRPAIYEIRDSDASFERLLSMAGGYARLADRDTLQIESYAGGALSVRTVDLKATSPASVRLADGDVAVVREGSPRLENVVYVVGNVARPGRYAWREGLRVSDVLTPDALVAAGFWLSRLSPRGEVEAGLRVFEKPTEHRAENGGASGARGEEVEEGEGKLDPTVLDTERRFGAATEEVDRPDPVSAYPEPFLEYALIRRLDPATKEERRLSFHLGKAVIERDPKEDLALLPQDTVVVFPRDAFALARTVHVSGAVNVPGEHRFYHGMRLVDLVRASGGLLPEAHLERAVLTRIHPKQEGARFETLEVDLRALTEGREEANLPLQPDDSLAVRVVPDYRRALRVRIEGEVRQPGTYTVVPGERLSALIERAGGFSTDAYLPGAQFYRASVRQLQQERLDESLRRLETETKLAAQKFTSESAAIGEEVDVKEEQARIERLIANIRGTPAKGRMVIRLRDPQALRGTEDDVELAEGDVLEVPRRPQEVHVVGAVFNQTALVYKEGLRVRDYLRECGGPLDTADTSIAYVIRADGTADSAQHARQGYRWDSERGRYSRGDFQSLVLYPGDTVVVPYDVKPQLSSLGLTKTVTQVLFQAAMATGVVVALL